MDERRLSDSTDFDFLDGDHQELYLLVEVGTFL
jgi:hypothetical protein